jgi:hypothetical protein
MDERAPSETTGAPPRATIAGECDSNVLFRVVPHSLYQIGADHWLIYSDHTGRIVECDGTIVSILEACQGCRPLDEHRSVSIQRTPGVEMSAVRDVLSQLVTAGLLSEYVRPPGQRNHPARASSFRVPSTLAIVTADRSAHLRRCTQSFLAHFKKHGHAVRLLVVDGSQRRECRNANRAALHECTAESPGRIDLIDAERLETILQRLGQAAGSAGGRFLLTGGTTGANRNIALLATAGEDVLMVDDDVVCEPWQCEGQRDEVGLAGHSDPRHLAYFPARQDAIEAATPAAVDLLAAHGRLLGRTVDELAACHELAGLASACNHMTAAAAGQQVLRIRATFAGLAGDTGTYSPQTLLFSTGRWKAALSVQTTYDLAFRSRECHRIADAYAVTHDPQFMATCVALDNRAATPPFMPVGRNEDGVFGVMWTICDPTVAYAHVPYGVIHDSDRPSAWSRPRNEAACETRISEALIAMLQSYAHGAMVNASADRMSVLGRWFEEIGTLRQDAFRSLLTRALLERRQRELRHVDSAVSGFEEYPEYWVRDLIAYREELLGSMASEVFFTPLEFRRDVSEDAGLFGVQAFVSSLGAGLREWNELWTLWSAMGANPRVQEIVRL